VKVLGISGSLRRDSYNMKLLRAAEELLPAVAGFEIWEDLKAVPPFDEDDEPGGEVVETLRDAVAEADVLLFATPEYNASIPGQLKNAIDWLSRPFGASAISGKPVAVIGTSYGQYGGVWAHDDARRAAGIAGGTVLDVAMSIPNSVVRFAGHHPADDQEVVSQILQAITDLAAA